MASSPKPPTPVDPNKIISAQEQANRVNRYTPFGNQTYGADGSLTTTLPQGTQNAFNNISDLAGNKQQFMQAPSGTSQLQDAIMNKISSRYQPQQSQKAGPQQLTSMNGSGNLAPSQGAWNGMFNMLAQNGQMPFGGAGGGGMPPMTTGTNTGMQMPNYHLPTQGPQ